MARNMPLVLRMAAESANASELAGAVLLPVAQVLAVTIGFIAASSRPNVYFEYVANARYVNAQRITKRVFCCLVRIARYLLATVYMALTETIRSPRGRTVVLFL